MKELFSHYALEYYKYFTSTIFLKNLEKILTHVSQTSHLPSVTETSSNDTSIVLRFGAVALNKMIKKSSIFLNVIWAFIQVVDLGEFLCTSTFPGLP